METGKIYISKRARFSAAHRMYNPALSDKENLAEFGKCSAPGGHGHDYVLEVTICGKPDKTTGTVMNLDRLKEIIEKEIIARFDQKDINNDVEIMKGIIPSVENLVRVMWNLLKTGIADAELYEVRLWETENNCAWYRAGENT
jgi:6-pyruvoyltetrahydropterin/6-carboxytetrahydropterin synthase